MERRMNRITSVFGPLFCALEKIGPYGVARGAMGDPIVDLFTFFRPPAPHARLFTLTRPRGASPREGDHHAINES